MSIVPDKIVVPGSGRFPEPALTNRDMKDLQLPEEIEKIARAAFMASIQAHHKAGGVGLPAEPTPVATEMVTHSQTAKATNELEDAVLQRLDPELEDITLAKTKAAEAVAKVENWDKTATVRLDGGEVLSIGTARAQEASGAVQIDADRADGATHHELVSDWWRVISTTMQPADSATVTLFLAMVTNVNILKPWDNMIGWLTIVVLPVLLVLSQVWAAGLAGRRFNYWRQARWEGRRHDAERHLTSVLTWSAVTAVITSVPTTLILLRLRDMAQNNGLDWPWQIALMAFAVVVGLGVPMLKGGVVALDGSTLSRRQADLAAAVAQSRIEQEAALAQALTALGRLADALETLSTQTLPHIAWRYEQTKAFAAVIIDVVRILLGASEPHPVRPDDEPSTNPALPQPAALALRQRRVHQLQKQVSVLQRRLDAVPIA
jgi:hypothetical protein